MPRLVITDHQEHTQIFEISEPVVTLGRADSNDIVLDHPSVSRQHARITIFPEGAVLLADLNSLNGTFVNGRQIKDHQLADRDRVNIGVYELVYERPAELTLEVETGSHVDLAELVSETPLAAAPQEAKGGEVERMVRKLPQAVAERLRELERETQQLRLLLAVGKELSSVLVPEEIVHRVMDVVFQMENVERGFVMLRDEKAGFRPALVLYKNERLKSQPVKADPSTVVLSKTLIDRVTEERLPLLIRNIAEDERFTGSESLRISGVRSAMCAPLNYKDTFFGIFYVDCLSKAMAFTAEDLGILAVIAAQAALSFENARVHEQLSRHALERQALQRFMSPEVVSRILANPSEIHLGGETQIATILFADIRNFTRMAERMEPEAVVQLLNEFFSEVTEVIFDNGGTLDKYLGDGLMALFGAPIARPDDPVRAVKTAIEIKRSLARVKDGWHSVRGREFRIGIGINTGKVTAGNIGCAQRMDYTVIGDAVNLAMRLCAGAEGGQILISDATFGQLGDRVPTRKRETILVKGRERPVDVYEILWDAP
jgi:adenylate cyclase